MDVAKKCWKSRDFFRHYLYLSKSNNTKKREKMGKNGIINRLKDHVTMYWCKYCWRKKNREYFRDISTRAHSHILRNTSVRHTFYEIRWLKREKNISISGTYICTIRANIPLTTCFFFLFSLAEFLLFYVIHALRMGSCHLVCVILLLLLFFSYFLLTFLSIYV